MPHEIMNQRGNHIMDESIRAEINHALEHALTYTYFEGIRIDIVSDRKTDKERKTIVNVEGIWG